VNARHRYWQLPFKHCVLPPHTAHAFPFVPHAAMLVEVTHVLSGWQQPNLQLSAPQCVK